MRGREPPPPKSGPQERSAGCNRTLATEGNLAEGRWRGGPWCWFELQDVGLPACSSRRAPFPRASRRSHSTSPRSPLPRTVPATARIRSTPASHPRTGGSTDGTWLALGVLAVSGGACCCLGRPPSSRPTPCARRPAGRLPAVSPFPYLCSAGDPSRSLSAQEPPRHVGEHVGDPGRCRGAGRLAQPTEDEADREVRAGPVAYASCGSRLNGRPDGGHSP